MSKQTVWVCVLLTVMAGAAWYVLSRKPEAGMVRVSLRDVGEASIDKITLHTPEGDRKGDVTLQLKDGVWVVGTGQIADAASVKRLLELVSRVETSNHISSAPSKNALFNTDEAKGVKVVLWEGKEARASLVVGKEDGHQTYVKIGENVFKMPYFSRVAFSKKPEDWVERAVFAVKEADVQKIALSSEGTPSVTLVRKDNVWEYENKALLPEGFRYSTGAAGAWVQNVLNVRAREVLAQDPGAQTTGLDAHTHTVTITLKEGEPVVFTLGAARENDTSYASVSTRKEVFALASSNVEFLTRVPMAFRDMGMMSFASNQVKEIRIQEGARQTVFAKNASKEWEVKGTVPKGFELQASEVDRWLDSVASVRGASVAESTVTLAQAGLNNASSKVECVLENGSKAVLVFGRDVKVGSTDAVYAQGNADNAVYHVPVYLRDSMLRKLESFKKASEEDMGQGFDPSALQNLPPDVRDNLMKQLRQQQMKQAAAH